jgi:peptidoglycan/LPS O-acetylase OafA/YrhL
VETATVELKKSIRNTSIPFRPDIEGLRGVAVALVVVYHAGLPFLRAGLIGVDIFFVVSGYLITSLLTQELNLSGRINLPRFYARRARRLLPAATLVVVAVCLAEAILASPLVQARVLKDAVATMLYSSNIYFCQAKRSYFFSGTPPSPLIHTWSLAVEEQFYLAWPVLLLLLARFTRSSRVKVFFLALITLVSFAGFLWLARGSQIMAFFQSPARAWEFGIGGVASFATLPWLARYKNLCGWAGIAGLLALILSAELLPVSEKFPLYLLTIPAIATAAVLLAGAGAPSSLVAGLLKSRPLQWLGTISYSLYLWHWPVLTIARNTTSNNSFSLRAGCIILAVLLAAATYVVVENPIRFQPVLMARPKLSLGLAALSLTICMAGFAGWGAALLHSQQFRKFHRAVEDAPALHALGCNADVQPKLCSFGETSRPVLTAVLFGDSHAVQWFPPLKDIAEANHWKLITMTKVGCSPMYINTYRPVNAAENPICDQWRTLTLAKIREMRPDMVVLTSSSQYPALGDPSQLVALSDWERGARKTFLALAEAGTNIRFIRDTPHADYDVPSCLAQREWNGRATCPPLLRSRALDVDVYKAETRGASNVAGVRFVDLSDAIFHGDQCMPEQGDLVLFRDGDHMTGSFAASLAGPLQRQLLAGLKQR